MTALLTVGLILMVGMTTLCTSIAFSSINSKSRGRCIAGNTHKSFKGNSCWSSPSLLLPPVLHSSTSSVEEEEITLLNSFTKEDIDENELLSNQYKELEDRLLEISSSSSMKVNQECVQRAQKEHDLQFQSGVEIFGCSASSSDSSADVDTDTTATVKSWSEEEFHTYHVPKGYAGPSESTLQNGNVIYETKEPILSSDECLDFIQAARETIQKEKDTISKTGTSANSSERTNSDLNEARLSKLPTKTLEKLQSILQTKLYPLLESKFFGDDIDGQDDHQQGKLTVFDGLILGHVAPSISQPIHRDASLLTLNIPLSSPTQDYELGGGTYIEGLVTGQASIEEEEKNKGDNNGLLPIVIEKGKALCHSSGIMHAGVGIGKGERWVMVLFLIAKEEPQIARRCHAEGLYALQQSQDQSQRIQKLNEAVNAFETGLSFAQKDHLLHMGVGQIASQLANINQNQQHPSQNSEMEQLSFDCLSKAAKYYLPSHKASIAMGKMLLMKRKPRAALRRFDQVLSLINNDDLMDGAFLAVKAQAWDARIFAARCAILCADFSIKQQQNQHKFMNKKGSTAWSNKSRLEEAIERLEIAMIPVPHDEQLQSLMRRAKELLTLCN